MRHQVVQTLIASPDTRHHWSHAIEKPDTHDQVRSLLVICVLSETVLDSPGF